jgi:acyl-CoA reductase-like NAD-dependent aldehyde dehydrogenase
LRSATCERRVGRPVLRSIIVAVAFLGLVSCRLPADREDLKLLPADRPVPDYADLYLRARSQATIALEAFYADQWKELAEAARALEQSAQFLPMSAAIPADRAPIVKKTADKLLAESKSLADAAAGKNVEAANEAMQRIQLDIRMLRPRINEPSVDGNEEP